ncbi:hypothetical protein C9374_013033 [Naegleria lovaniensis]|uniref:Uncharacterized protein n=1 Tax=Naegleria lovaniensis TaxID=51637 RepID=A0AA88GA49_NAELO|nr:uncharacterized protein C9374_013033 [Naegleria lovaniensis]KAG2372911.1 hypothetical protein C9374_013033 [Naegleria lovaniensis]
MMMRMPCSSSTATTTNTSFATNVETDRTSLDATENSSTSWFLFMKQLFLDQSSIDPFTVFDLYFPSQQSMMMQQSPMMTMNESRNVLINTENVMNGCQTTPLVLSPATTTIDTTAGSSYQATRTDWEAPVNLEESTAALFSANTFSEDSEPSTFMNLEENMQCIEELKHVLIMNGFIQQEQPLASSHMISSDLGTFMSQSFDLYDSSLETDEETSLPSFSESSFDSNNNHNTNSTIPPSPVISPSSVPNVNSHLESSSSSTFIKENSEKPTGKSSKATTSKISKPSKMTIKRNVKKNPRLIFEKECREQRPLEFDIITTEEMARKVSGTALKQRGRPKRNRNQFIGQQHTQYSNDSPSSSAPVHFVSNCYDKCSKIFK